MSKPISKKKRNIVYKMYPNCCMCGRELQNKSWLNNGKTSPSYFQIDPLIPKSMGGNNDISNLRSLCKSCNSSKGYNTSSTISNRINLRALALKESNTKSIFEYEKREGSLIDISTLLLLENAKKEYNIYINSLISVLKGDE